MAALQTLPRAARRYAAAQALDADDVLGSVGRLWRSIAPARIERGYLDVEPRLLEAVYAGQREQAAAAQVFVPTVLAELGAADAVEARAQADTRRLIGVAGDGRPVAGLMYQAVVYAGRAVNTGVPPVRALETGGRWLDKAVSTVLSDTGRASERLATAVRPVTSYVRMLQLPSCSRCAILAGRVYREAEAFLRHPRCDCRHVPSTESVAGDLTVSPAAYFDSLTADEQARLFTVEGAEAIREGADIAAVVNARRGMSTAQTPSGVRRAARRDVLGRQVLTTTAGARDRARPIRLMPEGVRQIATDRDDYVRLLRVHGYVR